MAAGRSCAATGLNRLSRINCYIFRNFASQWLNHINIQLNIYLGISGESRCVRRVAAEKAPHLGLSRQKAVWAPASVSPASTLKSPENAEALPAWTPQSGLSQEGPASHPQPHPSPWQDPRPLSTGVCQTQYVACLRPHPSFPPTLTASSPLTARPRTPAAPHHRAFSIPIPDPTPSFPSP